MNTPTLKSQDPDRAQRALQAMSSVVGTVSSIIAPLCLGLVAVFIAWDVFARYVLNQPTVWANEISTYLVVSVALIGACYAYTQESHIRVEILLDRLSETSREYLILIGEWATFLFVMIAGWQAIELIEESYRYGTKTYSLLLTPIWIPQIGIVLGWLMLCLVVAGRLASRISASPIGAAVLLAATFLPIAALLISLSFGHIGRIGPLPVQVILIGLSVLVACYFHSGPRAALGLILLILSLAVFLGVIRATDPGPGLIATSLGIAIIGTMVAGVHVFVAIGLTALVALHVLTPLGMPEVIAERSWEVLNSFTLTALPMFVLMGVLLLRSGVSSEVFEAMVHWVGRIPGGLAHSGVLACMIFSTVSGSSLATAATMGKVACPEMLDRNYDRRLALGSVAAGGTLGILIPPSIALIIYGSTVGVSIPQLFLAGIIPGLLLTFSFVVVIMIWALINPKAAPKGPVSDWGQRFRSLRMIAPMFLLIMAVLGSLYLGVTTPTEAGATGAVAAFMLCLFRGKINMPGLFESLREATITTGFLMAIIVGASSLTFVFDLLRVPQELAGSIQESGVSGPIVILSIALVFIILGMFVETTAMILLTIPVIFPVVTSLGYDPVWFGVFIVVLVEVGLITPPVGVNLFVLRGVTPGSKLGEIAYGVAPFGLAMIAVLIALFTWPEIATWLPNTLKK